MSDVVGAAAESGTHPLHPSSPARLASMGTPAALVNVPLIAAGDVIRIAEADYCYGRGELHLRVTHVPAGADLPGLEWINLLGVEIRWDGTDGRHRQALVRVAALRARHRNVGETAASRPPETADSPTLRDGSA